MKSFGPPPTEGSSIFMNPNDKPSKNGKTKGFAELIETEVKE
jgi:hypothetical protein